MRSITCKSLLCIPLCAATGFPYKDNVFIVFASALIFLHSGKFLQQALRTMHWL